MTEIKTLEDKYISLHENLLLYQNECKYISLLDELFMLSTRDLIEFSKINKIKEIMDIIKEKQLFMAYKITMYVYIRSEIYVLLEKICDSNLKLKKIFNNTQYSPLEKIIKIEEILKGEVIYINAYQVFPTNIKDVIANDIETLTNNSVNKSIEMWYMNTHHEIINRLKLLTKRYNCRMLSNIGIKIITHNDTQHMHTSELILYYNSVVRQIRRVMEKNIADCCLYIEIEKTSISVLLSLNHDIPITGFDMALKQ